ncbi:MAG: hypothetical protein LQ342_007041 [Letrouitia transgressa]|nr:MAG: hypothetical protein LQ342_007041 [Letrouitia transgressa]
MISRVKTGRAAQRALRFQCHTRQSDRRSYAVPPAPSGSYSFQTGENRGVKFGSRDLPGPTTQLAVVAKAGTRYQPLPGVSEGLEKFAFKSTEKRSSLRITRETELLGAELYAYHSRENLVIGAKFLRDDLPYFVELLGEVITQTSFWQYELNEQVVPTIKIHQERFLANVDEFALNAAHSVAFHRGLGTPLHPMSSIPLTKYLSMESIGMFSRSAWAKPNFAVVANGANHEELSQWVGDFFRDATETFPKYPSPPKTVPTKYHGGELRLAHDGGNCLVIAFPGSGAFYGAHYKPEIAVLSSLLGGQSNIKWSPGFSLLSKATRGQPFARVSTRNHTYSDAGLLVISLSGDASNIREASHNVVEILKGIASGDISKEDITKARAFAKFRSMEAGQRVGTGLELTGAGLIQSGKAWQIDGIGKAIEEVTETKVKDVSV